MSLAPLPADAGLPTRGADRQREVTALFDRSAKYYDRACSLMAFGSGQKYRRDALARAGVRSAMTVLDVGIGTGLLAREIARVIGPTGRVVGIDPSRNMLAAGSSTLNVQLVRGLGERLPFADARFDFVTMGFALRHVADLDEAFDEYRRVLKPEGRLLLLEITRPASEIGLRLARWYFGGAVPLATRIFTGSRTAGDLMRFYWDTIVACVPPGEVLASLRRAGFAAANRTVVHGIFSEYTASSGLSAR